MAGGKVFDESLRALAPFGRLVTYGISSREQNQVSNAHLLRGSKTVAGFWLAHCMGRPEMVAGPLQDLFERTARGELKPLMGNTYGLSDARRAHEDLSARKTTGKLTLDPSR
jgi:NADPH2:quinone reductase